MLSRQGYSLVLRGKGHWRPGHRAPLGALDTGKPFGKIDGRVSSCRTDVWRASAHGCRHVSVHKTRYGKDNGSGAKDKPSDRMGGSMKLNRYILGSTLVAALGGFLFGFDTAVISGTKDALEKFFTLAGGSGDLRWPARFWARSSGSLMAGKPAERFGRKPTLFGLAVFYFVSAVGCGLAWNWWAPAGVSFHRRVGHRRGIGGFADVHRRNCAGQGPRAARGGDAVEHRLRPSAWPSFPITSSPNAWTAPARWHGAGCWASWPCPPSSSSSC